MSCSQCKVSKTLAFFLDQVKNPQEGDQKVKVASGWTKSELLLSALPFKSPRWDSTAGLHGGTPEFSVLGVSGIDWSCHGNKYYSVEHQQQGV